ncbi:MAG: mechanosensitive ion channel [Gammaproteobacteria bacterium]|nr:mechanosensitive ion channel [Gammaproteobacteria bacterium]MBU1656131.1 mechanosensitive ion channel [Gammaproteobacteria bacterium]MBU1960379.1 mechanosensitive ion channel [Gammaproteobacteria bacterium]
MLPKSLLCLLIVALGLMVLEGPVVAAPPVTEAVTQVTPDLLESKIKEAEADTALDEAAKAGLIKLYRKAQTEIEASRNLESSGQQYEGARQGLSQDAKALHTLLGKPAPNVTVETLGVKGKTSLTQLEQLLVKEQADNASYQAKLAEIDAQLEQQINRPTEARQRQAEAKRELDELLKAMAAVPVPGEPLTLTEARKWAQQSLQRRLKAEIQAIEQEMLAQPARLELLQLQRDQTARDLATSTARVSLLQDLIAKQRKAEAQQAEKEAAAAQQDVAGKHPLLGVLADQNAQITTEISGSASELEKVNASIEVYQRQLKQYESDFKGVKQKMEIAGLSTTLGQVLMEHRRQIAEVGRLNTSDAEREALTASVGLRQIRHSEERKQLGDLPAAVAKLLDELPKEERTQLKTEVLDLYKHRRELLDKAIALDNNLLRRLVEVDFAERQLIDLVSAYDAFLAENLLWIRSVAPFDLSALILLPQELKGLLSPSNWFSLLTALASSLLRAPLLLLGLPVVIALMWNGASMRRKVLQTSAYVDDLALDRFSHSLWAILYVFLRALSWPLLFALIGWQLESVQAAREFAAVIADFFLQLVPVLFLLRLFWVMCEPGGVCERHFHWPKQHVALLRWQIYVLMLSLLPAAFVVITSSANGLGSERLGLSRLAFIVMMLSLAYFFLRLLNLRKGVVSGLLEANPSSLLARTKYIWYPATVGAPLVLAMLALFGYFYTAGTLTRSLVHSLLLMLGLILAHQIVIRWLLVRLQQARSTLIDEQVAERMAQQTSTHGAEETSALLPAELTRMDLVDIDAQTRKLLNTASQLAVVVGLWIIWTSVLPAFAGLNEIPLWQQTLTLGGEQQQVPVTLADLALAIIVAIVTAATARSLPRVIDILLLQQFAVKSGTRYAYETLTRYLIVGIGFMVIFSMIGGSWSEIQWLVAALSVGIGFGLQEIVANFISGLIILFERPIRVGDIVTVGDVSGVVSRIRIRATTITNWERQELLVPNKEFITNRLLNWTLTDTITRLTIGVGIAYGSDAKMALCLLEQAAAEHPRVLQEPPPLITFDQFGDNSLNLTLRCYLPNIDNRQKTISELHLAINDKLNAAGISIAYPQRDIHLDIGKPLEVKLSMTD